MNNIVDLRPLLPSPLPVASATGRPQGKRQTTTVVVWHYNGPPAPDRAGGTQDQIIQWLRDVIIPNHIQRIGADGVQYHYWVARDGTVYQIRDEDALLWHAGNQTANGSGIAIHIPIGGSQRPTDPQFTSACALSDWLIDRYKIAGRHQVRGHREFSASECPGAILQAMLVNWRTSTAFPRRMRVRDGIDFANVRIAPEMSAPVAMIGADPVRLVPGFVVEVAEHIGRWYRITKPDTWGFSHDSLYLPVPVDTPVGPPLILDVVPPPAQDDLTFVHEPRISAALFSRILREAQSPAAPDATLMYEACANEDVDPALLLAFFRKESGYGNHGLTATYRLNNPGNVRTAVNPKRGEQLNIPGRGQFFRFASWELGARDWAERMRDAYGKQRGLHTVRAALPTYAPASDNNNPEQYADQVISWVREWQRLENP